MAMQKQPSWSLSRARMFEECPRRYYYHYHLAPVAESIDAPYEAKLAFEMRQIKSLDIWVGDVVHQSIQQVLEDAKRGLIISADQARKTVREMLSQGWKASSRQMWRTSHGQGLLCLFEHYYGIPVGRATLERIKNKALTSITNFAESEIFRKISTTPSCQWLPIDKFACFRLNGLLIYVKPDFALRNGSRLIVYDWKTGQPTENDIRQLVCYALYASETWGVAVDNISVCPVHLQPNLCALEETVTESDIETTKEYLRNSFRTMSNSLRDPMRNVAAMADFPMTSNLSRCPWCNFKGICEQGKYASGELEPEEVSEELE